LGFSIDVLSILGLRTSFHNISTIDSVKLCVAHTSISPCRHPPCRSRNGQNPKMLQKVKKMTTSWWSSVICRGRADQEEQRRANSQSALQPRSRLQQGLKSRPPDLPMQNPTTNHIHRRSTRIRNVGNGEHVRRSHVPAQERRTHTPFPWLKPGRSNCTSGLSRCISPGHGNTLSAAGKRCGRNASGGNRKV